MATMMIASTATITKTKTITRATLIKYQTMMKVVRNHMMVLIMVTYLKITMKIIITQTMRKILMMIMLYSKIMIKIKMISTNMKNLQEKTEEEADVVVVIPYPEDMVD